MYKLTNDIGFDHGHGNLNIDKKAGIRYGVIPARAIGLKWLEQSRALYDLICPNCGIGIKNFDPFSMPDNKRCHRCNMKLTGVKLNNPNSFVFDKDGYALSQIGSSSVVFVVRSPYYTHAKYCDPSAPGACNLEHPLRTPTNSNRCYCLGHEWFEALSVCKNCPDCSGTGIKKKKEVPHYNEKAFIKNGGSVLDDESIYCPYCLPNIKTGHLGKIKTNFQIAPYYPIYSVKTGERIRPKKS